MTFQYNEVSILKKLQSISSNSKVLKSGNRDSTLPQKYFCYLLKIKSKDRRMTKKDFSKITGLGKDAFYGLNGYQKEIIRFILKQFCMQFFGWEYQVKRHLSFVCFGDIFCQRR